MARQSKASYAEVMPDGTRAIAGTRQVAWASAGVQTDSAMTAEEALKLAQLDFTVKVSKENAGAVIDGGKMLTVSDKYITYREHPKLGQQALGIVGSRYTPIQNSDAFEFLNHLVDESGAIFETAGSLGHGEKVFMALKFPDTMLAGGIDPINNYIMAVNSHDGSSSFFVAVTPLRLHCTNTIRMTMRTAQNKIALRHTAGATAKVQQARETLKLVFKYQEEFEREVEKLLSIKITDNEYKKFVETLIPEAKDQESVRQVNAVEKTRSELMGLWKADTQQTVKNTGWSAYNAVAEYVDWYKPVRGGESKDLQRAEKTITGESRLKQKAHDLLLSI